jgi:hypothetical protein
LEAKGRDCRRIQWRRPPAGETGVLARPRHDRHQRVVDVDDSSARLEQLRRLKGSALSGVIDILVGKPDDQYAWAP